MDDSDHTHGTVNSVESAIEVLERGLTLNLQNLDTASSDLGRHSRTVDRMRVILANRKDLTDLRRALVLEQRAFLTVRRRLVHGFLSTGIHLQLLDICKTRPKTSSFKDELAWKRLFDDVIKVIKEELVAAEGAFFGIAEEERRLCPYQ